MEHTALERIRIHDNSVLLILACEAAQGQYKIMTLSHLPIRNLVGVERTNQRSLSVTQHMYLIIKPIGLVCRLDRKALLRLRA